MAALHLMNVFKIDGSDDYNIAVGRILQRILTFKTGAAVIHKIASAKKQVEIGPDLADPIEINPSTSPQSWLVNAIIGQDDVRCVITFNVLDKAKNIITIQGGETHDRKLFVSRAPGEEDDERLCHELVHAARIAGDDLSSTPLPEGNEGYDSMEEFLATTVANIYLSEKGKTALRGGHGAYSVMSDTDPVHFLADHEKFRLIDEFCNRHPVMAPMIAKAPAAFNPVREYYKLKGKLLNRVT